MFGKGGDGECAVWRGRDIARIYTFGVTDENCCSRKGLRLLGRKRKIEI